MQKKTIETTNVTRRRISWAELWKIRPDLRPVAANDDKTPTEERANAA